ncbi:hypothetical protein YB2330_003579 [Saitoella coloradoensis]
MGEYKQLSIHDEEEELGTYGGKNGSAVDLEDLVVVHPPMPTTPTIPRSSPKSPSVSRHSFIFWTATNILATLGIVFVNKRIFEDPKFRTTQTLFVAYHFALTAITMRITSFVGAFEPKRDITWWRILPLCVAFAASTVVTNLSLAYLDVPTYQLLRVLLTPTTVIINLVFYRTYISRVSTMLLAVVCWGVACTIYYDPAVASSARQSTVLGYTYGFGGVVLAGLYTVWIATYHSKFSCSSMQLLSHTAPLSAVLLICMSPFLDTYPETVPTLHECGLLAVSGCCAVILNLSHFFIVAGSSAVSSTVVGHAKTCLIVLVGWAVAGKSVTLESVAGFAMALTGIGAYSLNGLKEGRKGRR